MPGYPRVLAAGGGVGLFLCQLARRRGAKVVGLASSEAKRSAALAAGAKHVFGYENWREEVLRSVGTADVVYDSIGATLPDSLATARTGGTVVFYGMAGGGYFDITVTGRGAHGARPEVGIDPVIVASHITTALQTIVSRNVRALDTAVLSVTQIHAGDAYNVIPEQAFIRGTARAFAPETLRLIEDCYRLASWEALR